MWALWFLGLARRRHGFEFVCDGLWGFYYKKIVLAEMNCLVCFELVMRG